MVNGTEAGALNAPVAVNGNAGTATVQSSPIVVNTPGRYCWRAVYTGDASKSVPGSSDFTVDECFRVADTSSTTTAQNWLPNDSATITSGAGTALAGNAVFTLYDGAIDCAAPGTATVLYGPESRPVSGASPQTVSTTNTATTIVAGNARTVTWRVVFTSTDPNVGSAAAKCETTIITINN